MTADALRARTAKDLAQMAKKKGVDGWHSMRKEQLIRALLRVSRRSKNGAKAGRAKSSSTSPNDRARSATRRPQSGQGVKQLRLENSPKDLAKKGKAAHRDRLIVMVRGPYWLHAHWELTRRSIERAAAALDRDWHTAQPVLRLLTVNSDGKISSAESHVRDIDIHGGVSSWYVDVADPPERYRLEIGYLAQSGKFHRLARSNIVSTPPPGSSDELDENWGDVARNFDKIYAMSGGYEDEGAAGELKELFEERLRRPMGSPTVTRFGAGAQAVVAGPKLFHFEVDAELIIYGTATPGSHVSVRGEPIELREDGSFTVRSELPDRRQVIPVVATTADGVEQRTICLALERNTKVMETLIREPEEPAR